MTSDRPHRRASITQIAGGVRITGMTRPVRWSPGRFVWDGAGHQYRREGRLWLLTVDFDPPDLVFGCSNGGGRTFSLRIFSRPRLVPSCAALLLFILLNVDIYQA